MDKQYLVLVTGDIDAALPASLRPMELDEVALAPAQVDRLGPNLLSVIIHEGRNRQVRRMCGPGRPHRQGPPPVREGNIQLGGLKLGTWRFLTEEEVEQLRRI